MFRPTLTISVDLFWDEPSFVRFARRLGRFSRTVWCDNRGMGASGGNFLDSVVEEIVDADVTVVLDAVGRERVVLVGTGDGGPTVIRYGDARAEMRAGLDEIVREGRGGCWPRHWKPGSTTI